MNPARRTVLVALCFVVSACSLTAYAQLESTRIAFLSQRDGNHEVYVMSVDGTTPVNLTNHPAIDNHPVWSPDGTRIAFHSDRDRSSEVYDVYIMEADGGNVTRVTDGVGSSASPGWSPDGTQLTFQSTRGGALDIYVIDANGANLTRLTDDAYSNSTPTWSPDGSQILFVSSRTGGYDIYSVSPSGGALSAVIEHPTFDGFPAWSPDGSQIAFHSYRDGVANVYIGDANGTNPVTNIVRLTTDPIEAMEPSFAPDGSLIAFRTRRHGRIQIYTIDPITLAEVRLTNTASHEAAPDWSPVLAPTSFVVLVDVKPGSEDNPINLRSKGVTPVAILTTAAFDATQVDGETVRLGTDEASIAHGKAHYEDVNGDGSIDWLGHFRTRKIGVDADTSSLTLVGQTLDGVPLSGSDLVTLRGGKLRGAPSLTSVGKRPTTWGAVRREGVLR